MRAIVDPFAGRGDPLAGGNDGGVTDDGHQIAMAARLCSENAETVLGVMESDPLDEAGEHFLGRWLRIGLHTDRRTIRFGSWRYVFSPARSIGARGFETIDRADSQKSQAREHQTGHGRLC